MQPEPLSSLVANVRPYVHGCPDFVIKPEVRKAYIDFCARTRILFSDIQTTFDADETGSLYDVTFDTSVVLPGHRPTALAGIRVDGAQYRPIYRLFYTPGEESDKTPRAGSCFYYFPHKTTISAYPFTSLSGSVDIEANIEFVPENDVDEMEGRVFADWHEAVEFGAMMRLYRLPRREWTDTNEAERCRIDFWRGVAAARTQKNLKGGGGELSAQMHPFV